MKSPSLGFVYAALLSLCALAIPAAAQQQVSGPQAQIVGNGNTAFVTAGNALKVDVASVNGTTVSGMTAGSVPVTIVSGGGGTAADESTFTEGTTGVVPIGCYFKTSPTNLSTTQLGGVSCTNDRSLFINLNKVNGTALGAPSNYGTSPGAISVIGVNAFVTNTPAVSQSGTWNVGISAGTNIVGKTVQATACGATVYSAAWQALTTSPVAITSTSTCVEAITACNTSTTTAYTFTLTDNSGTPVNVVNAASIPPSSCYTYPFYGQQFTSGIKWSASNVAVTGAILGYQ